MTGIYASFGNLGYWHEVEQAPLGEPEARATELWELYSRSKDLPGTGWAIPPKTLKALALELAVHFNQHRCPIPVPLLRLLAGLLGLPESFLDDPSLVFEGGRTGRPPDRPARTLAVWLDAMHQRSTGTCMSVRVLTMRLTELGHPVGRATASSWRSDDDYLEDVRLQAWPETE